MFERWNLTIWEELKIFLFEIQVSALAIGKVFLTEILGRCTLTS